MNFSRRDAMLSTLFGAGFIGLRALATGLPAAFLLNPRKAFAQAACPTATSPQYIIFSTSFAADPLNTNAPGTYANGGPGTQPSFSNITHSPDKTMMAPTPITLGGQTYTAAAPWKTLPLDRTAVFHIMTNTPVHPKEPYTLALGGASPQGEMLPSLLAKALAPCLNTVQTQPLSIGAVNPSEALSFSGTTLPIVPPLALKATLANPNGVLSGLQPLRDQTMNKLYELYNGSATAAQKTYIDSMVTSQTQVRDIKQALLDTLDSIQDNTADYQMTAAIALILMNVSPVIAVHIPFGGDNHNDDGLATETAQSVAGFQTIVKLLSGLGAPGVLLTDKVSLVTLNVFGRTLGPGNGHADPTDGRQHNQNHQVSLCIGKPFKSGVYGGIMPVGNDYGCTAINSTTGTSSGGDIQPIDTLASFGQTMLAAVGAPAATINSIAGPAGTSKVIKAALA